MQVAASGSDSSTGGQSGSRKKRDNTRQGPWRCGNCPKEFAQKEYRDKHQRRCIQAASRQKTSKQKSCVPCATSKLGCDLGTPSCSRCINRNKRCQYVSATAAGPSTDKTYPQNDPQTSRSGTGTVTQPEQNPFQHLATEGPVGVGENVPLHAGSSVDPTLDLDDAFRTSPSNVMGLSPSLDMNLGHWPIDQSRAAQDSPESLAGGMFSDPGMSPGWLRRNFYPFDASRSDNTESSPQPWQANDPWASRGTIMTPDGCRPAGMNDNVTNPSMTGLPSDELNFDLLGSLGVLTRNRITPALDPGQAPMEGYLPTGIPRDNMNLRLDTSARNLIAIDPNLSREARSGRQGSSTLHDAVKPSYDQPSLTLRGKPDDMTRPSPYPFFKFPSSEELVRIISSYPRIMVRPGEYPPFVHHKLYRCSTGDIPEPLAKAFCCIGAFYSSVPTSKNYVYNLLNEESGALVKEFQKWSGSDGDMLAVVHAMCIYQILGFFVSNSPDQVRLTELQHVFFLKMTRRLIQEYLQSPPGGDSEEANWRKWIINETIRRTLFLVNTINTLSCKTQRQDAYYYEPLDDNLIRNMVLPAPDSLWNASSAEEWLIAKAQLDPNTAARSRLTVQQVLNQIEADRNERHGAGSGMIQQPLAGSSWRISYADLDEFTRLILSTIGSPLAEGE